MNSFVIKKLSSLQKKIIVFLQADIPCTANPYAGFAKENNITEKQVVEQIKLLKKNGYIRRFGAILSHNKVGLKVNCMCVWIVPEPKLKKISGLAVKVPQISHCYVRKTAKDWPYNFYTMIHGKTKKEVREIIESIVKASKVSQYRMLFTKKEFKKISPVYRMQDIS